MDIAGILASDLHPAAFVQVPDSKTQVSMLLCFFFRVLMSYVVNSPLGYAARSITGTLSSSAFVGMFVAIFQAQICTQRHVFHAFSARNLKALAKVAGHRWWAWWFGKFLPYLSLIT